MEKKRAAIIGGIIGVLMFVVINGIVILVSSL